MFFSVKKFEIVHAFFQSGHEGEHRDFNRMEFADFVKVLAHFRPIKKEKLKERNILNSRRDKLRCKNYLS